MEGEVVMYVSGRLYAGVWKSISPLPLVPYASLVSTVRHLSVLLVAPFSGLGLLIW